MRFATLSEHHKFCGVYWMLDILSAGCHSALSIYLAVLCKTQGLIHYLLDNLGAYSLSGFLENLKDVNDNISALLRSLIFSSKFLKLILSRCRKVQLLALE